jgi:hypothetical protein
MKKVIFLSLLGTIFAFSAGINQVKDKGVAATVTINISTSGGESPIGAQVTLANHDGLPEHTYTALSPPDGIVTFPDVFEGIYDLSIDLFDYQPYRHNNWSITQDITINVVLLEIPYPPTCLYVDFSTLMVYWCRPGGYSYQNLFSEPWDSGTFTANEWTFDPAQGNWGIYSPVDVHPATYAQFNFWPEVYDYSYSLVSKTISYTALSGLWLSFDLSFSNYLSTTDENLSVEVWNGSSWSEVTGFSNQDFPEGIPWTTFTYDISELLQQSFDIKIRFRAWGQDSYTINWWDIDNINVRGERHPMVLGYLLYLGDSVIMTQDTCYPIPPSLLEWGITYYIGVRAVYASGVSERVNYVFTSTHLPPPRDLAGEDVGHTAHLTWQPPQVGTQPHKSEGVTWDELLTYNNLTEADLYHPPADRFSCGLPPPDRKPIHLINPNGNSGIDAITSRAFAYNAYSTNMPYDYPTKFILMDPGDIENFGPYGNGNFFSGACWGPNNLWYATRYYGQFGTVDTTTGEFTQISSGLNNPAGLAWDVTTETMYMNTFGNGGLYTIDPATGATDLVGTSNAIYYIDLTCTNGGQLYALDMYSQAFGMIDKSTGAWTPVIYSPFQFNYAQGMSIDREEDIIYWAAYNNEVGGGQLWTIDPEAETMYYLGDFEGQCEIDGMIIPSSGGSVPPNLIGYRIYRDGDLIGSTDADTLEYYDYNLLAGYYSYDVTALYDDPTPGDSQGAGPVDVYIHCDGVITGSVSVPGAIVTLIFGNDSSIVISDSTGHFYYVVQEGTYTLCVEADGYETECIYNLFIPCDQTITIDIILMEFPYPAFSVSAVTNEADTTVIINWYPYYDFYMVAYDDGIADDVTAWDEGGNMNAVRFTPTQYPADIYGFKVNIYDGSWPPGDILTPFKMAIYDDDGDNDLPGTELAVVDVAPYDYGWVYADFSNAGVTITNGDFYGVMIQESNYPDCAPISVDESSHADRSYSRDVSHSEPWRPAQFEDFMMRAYIYDTAGQTEISNSNQPANTTRELDHYKVYVLPQGQEGNPDAWTLKNDNLTQTTYTDTDWAGYPAGWYRYAVVGEYTYNQSEPAFSNLVEQVITGIHEPSGELIRVYPVPAKQFVNVEVSTDICRIRIINYTGQVVHEQNVGKEKAFRINTTTFGSGTYLIEFISDNGNVITRKMVIVR